MLLHGFLLIPLSTNRLIHRLCSLTDNTETEATTAPELSALSIMADVAYAAATEFVAKTKAFSSAKAVVLT
jgi:hypothetical protein